MSLPYFTTWLLLNVLTSIEEHKQSLSHHFEMNEIGNLSYILGLEASSSNDDYYLSQENYASNLTSHLGLTDYKLADMPLDSIIKLCAKDGESVRNVTINRQLVGCLLYLSITRPDISHIVHLVS